MINKIWMKFEALLEMTKQMGENSVERKAILQLMLKDITIAIEKISCDLWEIIDLKRHQEQFGVWRATIAHNGVPVMTVSNELDQICYFYQVIPNMESEEKELIQKEFKEYTKEWWNQMERAGGIRGGDALAETIWVDWAINQYKLKTNSGEYFINTIKLNEVEQNELGQGDKITIIKNRVE